MLRAGRRSGERVWAIEGCNGPAGTSRTGSSPMARRCWTCPRSYRRRYGCSPRATAARPTRPGAHSVALAALRSPNLVTVEVHPDLVALACWPAGATSSAGHGPRPSTGSTGCCPGCSPAAPSIPVGGAGPCPDRGHPATRHRRQDPPQARGRADHRAGRHRPQDQGLRETAPDPRRSPGLYAAAAARHRPLRRGPAAGRHGNIHRFASRDHFASWNGTAPLDASPGQQQRHRLSRAGNRRINRALHIMAVVQLRNRTEGRACYDARKAAGKTSMEAMRCLKRRLSSIACRQMLHDQDTRRAAGPGGHSGTTLQSSVTDLTPDIGSSDKPLPGPATPQRRTTILAASLT